MAALEAAIERDAQAEANAPSLFKPAPEQPQQATDTSAPQGSNDPATGAAPEGQQPQQQASVDTFDGGAFNPDTLPDELKPAWHQLQASYTRKTQELAEKRKQVEALGDVESVQQAVELYHVLQDPANWPALYEELSQALGVQPAVPGQQMQPGQAQQPAGSATQPQQPVSVPGVDPNALQALAQDPELAPVAQLVDGLQRQVAATQQQLVQTQQVLQAQHELMQQEQQQLAVIGEIQRQHNAIAQMNPHYTDADYDAIYEIAVAHGGNLLKAQERYEAMKNAVLSNYLQSKSSPQEGATPVPGGSVVAQPEPRKPQTLEEATEYAIEALKAAGKDTLPI